MLTSQADGQRLYSCDVCHRPINGSIWCHDDGTKPMIDRCSPCSDRYSDALFVCWQDNIPATLDTLAVALAIYARAAIDHVRAGSVPIWAGAPAYYDGRTLP